MANDYNHPNRSRSLQRAKRRKTNIVLNSLIVIVLLLIIIVATSIFWSGGKNDKNTSAPATTTHKKAASKNTDQSKNETNDQNNGNNDNSADNSNTNGNDTDDNHSNNSNVDENGGSSLDDSEVVANEGNDANVEKTYANPNWAPVGTNQTNGHQYSSDSNSVDWKEKEKALSYATGIPSDQMTIWYMSRDQSDSSVIGTITSKESKQAYRVYLEWVDGQGWKPTKVEELKQNDRH